MESSVEHLEDLLDGYLTDNSDDSEAEFNKNYSYNELPNPPPLKNEGWDDEFRDHVLLQENDPKLACLAVGEDDPYFPGDDDDQWGVLGTYLGNSEYLTELRLGCLGACHVYQIMDLCTGLARNRSITRLRITHESVFRHSLFLHLVPFLQENAGLRHLVVAHDEENFGRPIELKDKGLLMLAVALAKFTSLQTIELTDICNGEELDDEFAPYIFDALRSHPGLVSVNLEGTVLGRKAKAALTKLDVGVNPMSTAPGAGEAGDLYSLLGSLRGSNSPTNVPERFVPARVQPGILCKVKGLQSEGGRKLNGRRCAVLRFAEEEGRYEVLMENEPLKGKTWALREANLSVQPKLVLPTHSSRGMNSTPESLAELLLYYKGSGPYTDPEFSPSHIMLVGLAASSLNRIDQSNLMWLVQVQMEQMAGALALASICEDGDAAGVLFALLEGDPMYVDVLLQTIHWTGRIDHESRERDAGFDGPPSELSPDQDTRAYVYFMSRGPLGLMAAMARVKFGTALWAALRDSEFYHLFVRRLLRLVAREALGTYDGVKLGPVAKKILQSMLPGVDLLPLRHKSTATKVLKCTCTSPQLEDTITAESVTALIVDRNNLEEDTQY